MDNQSTYITKQDQISDIINKVKLIQLLQLHIQKGHIQFNDKFLEMSVFLQKELKINLINDDHNNKFDTNRTTIDPVNDILPYCLNSFSNINRVNIDNNNNLNEEVENSVLKSKYLEAKNLKDHPRHFQVYFVFKNKIKRMYRVDCMTRKINVNFYHYLKENYQTLNINDEFLEFFRNNIRYTSREKFKEISKKYPQFTDIYNLYLKSFFYKKLFHSIKKKYDTEYQKLFFRHSFNFLNFYLKENDPVALEKFANKKKRLGKKIKIFNEFKLNKK